ATLALFCGRVRVVFVSPPGGEPTDAHTVRTRVRPARPPARFPAEGILLAPGRQVFWLGDRPPPAPSRRTAVVATGFVPPHSCGAARESHPLPLPAWGRARCYSPRPADVKAEGPLARDPGSRPLRTLSALAPVPDRDHLVEPAPQA